MTYSKGVNGFSGSVFVFAKPFGGDYDAMSVIDCNGDGKSDIIHKYLYQNNTRIDVYYSTGSSFVMQRYDTPGYLGSTQFFNRR